MADVVDYIKEINQHQDDFPTHGTNCSCMDQIIWKLRADIREGAPFYSVYPPDNSEQEVWQERVNRKSRIQHVFTQAFRD